MIDIIWRIAALCRKELLAIFKDPASRVILLAPALVQSVLFGYAATYDLNRVPYALLDQSHSAASAEFVARLEGSGVFQRVASLRTPADIRRVIDAEQALLALTVPPDFQRELSAGRPAVIQLILDARNSNTAAVAAGYIAAVTQDFNAAWGQAHGYEPPPLELKVRHWFNPNLETRWNLMPGLIAALSMLQTLLLTALSVAREREQGTFDQLLVTPLSSMEIMVGKSIPPVLVGLAQATLIWAVTRFWFGIPMAGSVAAMFAGLALFTTASVGIGLSISALSATMQQAMFYTFVLVMPLMLLSGLTTPVANMPEVLQAATLANPLRFAIEVVQRVYLEGAGLTQLWRSLLPMAGIAAVTLPLSAWLFRNHLE